MEVFIPIIHDRLIDPCEQTRLEGTEQIRIEGIHNTLKGRATMVIIARMVGKFVRIRRTSSGVKPKM